MSLFTGRRIGVCILATIAVAGALVLVHRTSARAHTNQWGGVGSISISQREGKTYITYRIVDADGTGTAGLTCFVQCPGEEDGRLEMFAAHAGEAWRGNSLTHTFVYPDDFGDADLSAAGVYRVSAWWGEFSGNGNDLGYVCGATETFERRTRGPRG